MSELAEKPNESNSLEQLWRAVHKGRYIILVTCVLVTAGAAFWTLGQTKVYRSTTVLQIDPTPPSPLGTDVPAIIGADTFWNNQEYYATQYRILKSRKVAAGAVRELRLDRDGGFLRGLPAGAQGDATATERETIDLVLGRLAVDPIKESRLVTVTFDDPDPERARRILAAVVNAYLQGNIDDVASSNTSASEWLREQLITLKNDLESSELSLHDYKRDNRILSVSLDDQSNMLREEMKRLNDALTDVRVRREHIVSRTRELEKIDANDPVELPATELLQSNVLTSLRASYVTSKSEFASLTEGGKGEQHPEVRAAAARVGTAREALLREVKNIKGALRGDLAAVSREAGGLDLLYERAKQRGLDLNKLEIEYRRLERTKTNNEKLFGVVLERTKESDLASMMKFNNIRVIEEPLASRAPVRPNVPLSISIGLIGGLALGLLLAVAREQFDRSVKTSDDVERELGIAFLGTLPLTDAAGPKTASSDPPELIAHSHTTSMLAEAARGIRTNLLFMSPDEPYRRMLITSPGPGEGKTTVASTIAIVLAQTGQRVLLVDCDLRRPRLHKIFGRLNDVGVTSMTLEPNALDPDSLATLVPNLSLLPAGPRVPNPAEFLGSEAFKALLDRLSERYDRVIVDSPPATIVSDATILATMVDGIVLIARSMQTPKDSARKAIRTLQDVGGSVVGAVLNALDPIRLGYGRYKYYNYAYGYYGHDRDDAA